MKCCFYAFQSHRVGKRYFYALPVIHRNDLAFRFNPIEWVKGISTMCRSLSIPWGLRFNPIEWVNGISTATYGSYHIHYT